MSKEYTVWDCKIGVKGELNLPLGADWPMRQAIARAFFELTGQHAEFNFSGWGGTLNDVEKSIVEKDFAARGGK